MIVVSINAMAISMANSNTITMILIMTVINGVVVRPIGVTLSMIRLIAIAIVGMIVRGGRIVVLTDITILGMLLSV